MDSMLWVVEMVLQIVKLSIFSKGLCKLSCLTQSVLPSSLTSVYFLVAFIPLLSLSVNKFLFHGTTFMRYSFPNSKSSIKIPSLKLPIKCLLNMVHLHLLRCPCFMFIYKHFIHYTATSVIHWETDVPWTSDFLCPEKLLVTKHLF